MNIMIIGARGRLGSSLHASLPDAIGLDIADCDIADFNAVRACIRHHQPNLVIQTAAWTDVDGCAREPEKAIAINGFGTQHIALATAEIGATHLYVSTNEVFDGRARRPYYEYDPTNPINAYGYSKVVGERALMTLNPRHYLVRTAWLFAHGGKNFIQSILNAVAAGKPLRVVTDEIANPTYNEDLALAILQLIQTERYGVYHFTNQGTCSRFTLARYVLERAGHTETPISPITRQEWTRPSIPPSYSSLANLAGNHIGITLRPWQEAVDAFLIKEGLV